jgi:hypothetical protein
MKAALLVKGPCLWAPDGTLAASNCFQFLTWLTMAQTSVSSLAGAIITTITMLSREGSWMLCDLPKAT